MADEHVICDRQLDEAHDELDRLRGELDRLGVAAVDLCWKAVQFGATEDGDTLAYILPKGTVHRLIGAAQSAGYPAVFRAPKSEELAAEPVVKHEDFVGECGMCRRYWDAPWMMPNHTSPYHHDVESRMRKP